MRSAALVTGPGGPRGIAWRRVPSVQGFHSRDQILRTIRQGHISRVVPGFLIPSKLRPTRGKRHCRRKAGNGPGPARIGFGQF